MGSHPRGRGGIVSVRVQGRGFEMRTREEDGAGFETLWEKEDRVALSVRFRANSAHVRQSVQDSGVGSQVIFLNTL